MEKKVNVVVAIILLTLSLIPLSFAQDFSEKATHDTLFTNKIDSRGNDQIQIIKPLQIADSIVLGKPKLGEDLDPKLVSTNLRVDINGQIQSTGLILGGVIVTNWNEAGAFKKVGDNAIFTGGKVGIGIEDPNVPEHDLDVAGSAKFSKGIEAGKITIGRDTEDQLGEESETIGHTDKGKIRIKTETGIGFYVGNDLKEKVTIDNNGNLIIEKEPGQNFPLQVKGNAEFGTDKKIQIKANDGQIVSTADLLLTSTRNQGITITEDGSVGIGTQDPEQALGQQSEARILSIAPSDRRKFGLIHILGNKPGINDDPRLLGEVAFGSSGYTTGNKRIAAISALGEGFQTSGSLRFSTSDNGNLKGRIWITKEGDLGINTDDPKEKVDVNGNVQAINFIVLEKVIGASGTNKDLKLQMGSTDGEIFFITPSGGDIARINTKKNMGLGIAPPTEGQGRLAIGDRIGINTNAPEASLHVGGGSSPDLSGGGEIIVGFKDQQQLAMGSGQITVRDDGKPASLELQNKQGEVVIHPVGSNNLVAISNDGKIGIQTRTPEYELHITRDSTKEETIRGTDLIVHPQIMVNGADQVGGGIQVSNDGGFFDFNNGWITYESLIGGGEGLRVNDSLNVVEHAAIGLKTEIPRGTIELGGHGTLVFAGGKVIPPNGTRPSVANPHFVGGSRLEVGIHDNDVSFFLPTHNKETKASDLRLYLLDDADERFSVWGDSCRGGSCDELIRTTQAFFIQADGQAFIRNKLAIGKLQAVESLDVNGDINAEGKIKESHNELVPAGAVMFFDMETCPGGWEALKDADGQGVGGRYIVGLQQDGTLRGAKGEPLVDLENRPFGKHDHLITDPGHDHGVTDPGHKHTVRTLKDDDSYQNAVDMGESSLKGFTPTSDATTGISVNDEKTSITKTEEKGAVSGTNSPYIQLKICVKI